MPWIKRYFMGPATGRQAFSWTCSHFRFVSRMEAPDPASGNSKTSCEGVGGWLMRRRLGANVLGYKSPVLSVMLLLWVAKTLSALKSLTLRALETDVAPPQNRTRKDPRQRVLFRSGSPKRLQFCLQQAR